MDHNWTECGVAYGDLKHRFSNHNPLTIKKAIVGMILASELPAVCADYSETALVYLTNEHASKSVDPWGSHTSGNAPPFDFWRYGMATRPDSDACFVSGNFGNELPMLAGDLPYRFFKSRFERDASPSDLYQSARGVSLSVPHLESLFADRRWSNVWPKKAEPMPRCVARLLHRQACVGRRGSKLPAGYPTPELGNVTSPNWRASVPVSYRDF